jgi:polyisoprenyl-phosphate glycosyltransferase
MRKELSKNDGLGPNGTGKLGSSEANLDPKPLVSIIIPAYNEEANISRLEKELYDAINGLPYRFEFILIDNASQDNTGKLIKSICERDPRWRYIRFSRNFRVESSITAGYHYASGDAMIVLYSDLQEPPNVIPQFLEAWSEGFDIVHGIHTRRIGEPALLSILVKIAYRFVSWCSESPIPEDAGDFRLISRRVRDAFEQCGDYHRYTRGLIAWLGFPQTSVYYERQARKAGKSNSDFSVYWSYFSNAITGFSLKPIRFFSVLGVGALCLSVALATLCLLARDDRNLLLFLALATIQFLLGGLTFLGIGILGEYCGRTYTEVKHRPLYIIQEQVNIPDSAKKPEETEMTVTR